MSGIRGDKRIDIGKNIIASYEEKGLKFEIIVDPDKSWEYRDGKDIDLSNVLIGYTIFEDVMRGERANVEDLIDIFGTDDVFKIADKILKEGNIQLTKERRKRLLEEKRKLLINYLIKNSIDPTKNLPHPPARIERAIEEAKVHIDPFLDIKKQAENVVSKISSIIPIRLEVLRIALKIPSKFSAKSYGIIEKYGTIEKDEWQKDGSWIVIVQLPSGLQQKLIDDMNNLTKGKFELKRL
ncbi:MAG: ribosome assembly factor SBDS [Candidatus Helarchaeota archaeon]